MIVRLKIDAENLRKLIASQECETIFSETITISDNISIIHVNPTDIKEVTQNRVILKGKQH